MESFRLKTDWLDLSKDREELTKSSLGIDHLRNVGDMNWAFLTMLAEGNSESENLI